MNYAELWADPSMRRALAERDITEVYRRLVAAGLNQRQIGQLTGQRPSEVSEVIHGRAVQAILVLERIADGLGVPPGWMGLAYTGGRSRNEGYPAEAPEAQEVGEDVKRRNFINAVAGAVAWGHPVVRELLTAPDLSAVSPLPRSLGAHDVTALRDMTGRMRALARQYGGQAETIGATAQRYTRLMTVGGTPDVKHALGSALAELHTVAGWCAHDAMTPDAARYHFGRAIELAQHAEDAYQLADALYHAGASFEESGGPNDALKLLQIGQIRLHDVRDHPRSVVLGSWFHMDSARAYATMGYAEQARSALTRARENWEPADVFDRADFDHVTAMVYRDLGQLDSATVAAATSARTWTAEQRRESVLNDITLAELYLKGGEPAGVQFAAKAVDGATELSSARARDHLTPLVGALAARRDSTSQDLAVRARAVAGSAA